MKKIGLLLCVIVGMLFFERQTPLSLNDFQSETKMIEIKGEVRQPGTYEVAMHATVEEIIAKAGGVNAEADIRALNLTRNVVNHEVIVVPKIMIDEKISINTASLEKLDELPGIGPSIAQRIIEYRKLTPFRQIDELKEVKGIGERLFEKLKDRICL